MLQVKVKKLSDKAVMPFQADSGSAGMDLTAISEKVVLENGITYIEYGTGLALEIPEGHVGLIYPRSSITSNTTLVLGNSVGIIDSSFRGEIKLRFKSIVHTGAKKYNIGDRIGQLIVTPYPQVQMLEVTELSETERNSGGFGSSGR